MGGYKSIWPHSGQAANCLGINTLHLGHGIEFDLFSFFVRVRYASVSTTAQAAAASPNPEINPTPIIKDSNLSYPPSYARPLP
jgi:hypothetical protein